LRLSPLRKLARKMAENGLVDPGVAIASIQRPLMIDAMCFHPAASDARKLRP